MSDCETCNYGGVISGVPYRVGALSCHCYGFILLCRDYLPVGIFDTYRTLYDNKDMVVRVGMWCRGAATPLFNVCDCSIGHCTYVTEQPFGLEVDMGRRRKKFVCHINEMLLGLIFNTKIWHRLYSS